MCADELDIFPHWFTLSPLPSHLDSPPPSVHVTVTFGARSRKGPLRFFNEDHHLVLRLGRNQETLLTSLPDRPTTPRRFDEYAYGMMVADGTGGNGEAASRLAITTLVHLTICFGKWNVRIDDPIADEVMDRGARFYRGINQALLQARRESQLGLESTLTTVFTAGSELFFAHVGDSRAYLYRDGELLQLTHDQTGHGARLGKAAYEVVVPVDEPETTATTEAPGPAIQIEHLGLLDGDTVLLCTDGLTDALDVAGIATALRLPGTPDDQCRALIDLAGDAGAEDDVTAVIAHYRIEV